MNTSPIITQALIETRQHDRLARAGQARQARQARQVRQVRQAGAAREATRARRTPLATFVWPVHWLRFTVRRTAFRDAV
jgi:hypothetical protein